MSQISVTMSSLSKAEKVICKYGGKTIEGLLYKDNFESGGKGNCILFEDSWITPNDFEIRSGSKAKKYLSSIKCQGKPLRHFVESGELKTKRSRNTLSNSFGKSQKPRLIKQNKKVTITKEKINATPVSSLPFISENVNKTELESGKDMEKDSEDDPEDIINNETIDKNEENVPAYKHYNVIEESNDDTNIIDEHKVNSDEKNVVNEEANNIKETAFDDYTTKDDHESTEGMFNSQEMDKDENSWSSFDDYDSNPVMTEIENSEINDEISPNPNDQVKICLLCTPNTHIQYSQENEEPWLKHLVDLHFKTELKAVLNKNTQNPNCCPAVDELAKNNSRKELQDHFLSWHGLETVEALYENEILIRQKENQPKSDYDSETTGDVTDVVEVLFESNQHNKRLLHIKSIDRLKDTKNSEKDGKELLKTKKCDLCETIIYGHGDERLNENWFEHLYAMHFKKELEPEVWQRMEEDTGACNACDFTSDENNKLSNHIVIVHRNEIFENLYANKIKETAALGDDTRDDDESTEDAFNSREMDKDENSWSSFHDYDSKPSMFVEDDDDVVVINPETEKPTTTKIIIQINDKIPRDFYISKPPLHITLHDVKEYLDKQPFFKMVKIGQHEFHVQHITNDGKVVISKMEHDHTNLPNINGEIIMECWSN